VELREEAALGEHLHDAELSSSVFAVLTEAIDFNILDSGLSEIIRFNLLKRLENRALYPFTPSPVVILKVGSNSIL
jgi:hypothetical protein